MLYVNGFKWKNVATGILKYWKTIFKESKKTNLEKTFEEEFCWIKFEDGDLVTQNDRLSDILNWKYLQKLLLKRFIFSAERSLLKMVSSKIAIMWKIEITTTHH